MYYMFYININTNIFINIRLLSNGIFSNTDSPDLRDQL